MYRIAKRLLVVSKEEKNNNFIALANNLLVRKISKKLNRDKEIFFLNIATKNCSPGKHKALSHLYAVSASTFTTNLANRSNKMSFQTLGEDLFFSILHDFERQKIHQYFI